MQVYAAYHHEQPKRPLIPLFISLGGIALLSVVLFVLLQYVNQDVIISPITAHAIQEQKPARQIKTRDPEALKRAVEDALDDSIPEYSIMVEDYLSPFTVEMGEPGPYEGASVHKIYILAATYAQIQEGKVALTDEITFQERDRQDYGTGSMRYKAAGTRYTIKELAELMMKQSDNTAAHILAQKVIGLSTIQQTIEQWGLRETSMEDNTTTNKDVTMLYRKLFTGRLFGASLTREAIDNLLDSEYEDRLPALLPNHARVYHKIGTAIAGLHDAGVVVTGDSMYYVGIFTKGVSDEERATRAIARVSKAVFDFMEE